jgi:beta-galactosidase
MTNYLKMLVMTSIISCSTVSINAQEPIPTSPMTHSMSLNGIWQFKYIEGNDIGRDSLFKSPAYDASDWQGIRVPGNWEIQGFDTPVYDGKLTPGFGLPPGIRVGQQLEQKHDIHCL